MGKNLLFDPDQEYIDPPLQGYRLGDAGFVKLEPDETGALVSEELALKLRIEMGLLQLYRLDTGERLLTGDERAELEAEGRRLEAEARRAAEAELARLREDLARRSSH